jgi:4-carboxymuconolactone decarboxylase
MTESKVQRGRRVRSEVLGPTPGHAAAGATASPDPFVELGLEFAWGTIWARDVIPVKTRRFVTMALLAAQDRQPELAMHFRAALTHGCTVEELREVCMHVTCYCGFPTAAEALRTLDQVAAESAPASAARAQET